MCDGDYTSILFHKSKAGYWFTYVAFEIYLIYAGCTFVMDKIGMQNSRCKAVAYVVLSVLALPLSHWIGVSGFKDTEVCGLFSLVSVVSYTPFFLLGVVAKMHNGWFVRLVENKWVVSTLIVVFASMHTGAYLYHLDIKLIFYGTAGVLLVYAIFHNFRNIFCNSTRVGRSLGYIGKRTLPIYLTHYYLLDGVASTLAFPAIQQHLGWMSGLVYYFLFALLIVGACLLVEALFRKAHPLYRLCFGYPN